jgi:hypothetical protein
MLRLPLRHQLILVLFVALSISLREAGRTPAKKRAHYFLVYHGDWLIATALDIDGLTLGRTDSAARSR